MSYETRSSSRLLRSAAAVRNIRFVELSGQRKTRTRRLRLVALQASVHSNTSYEAVENFAIAPEYEWIRVVYLKHGPKAMKLLMEMTQTNSQHL